MKFVTYVENKETRFPEFNVFDHNSNDGVFVFAMKIYDDNEIKELLKNKNKYQINFKFNFLLMEKEDLVYAFNLAENEEFIKNNISRGVGIRFAIEDKNENILDDFSLSFIPK